MVIECISCSRRFNLNENLLKPTGSMVRCTKCGNIFPAYPSHKGNNLNPALETDSIDRDADQGESATSGFEKRKHFRVPISIPVICDALDFAGNPCDIHVGSIKDLSQFGLPSSCFPFRFPSRFCYPSSMLKTGCSYQSKVVFKNKFIQNTGRLFLAGSAVDRPLCLSGHENSPLYIQRRPAGSDLRIQMADIH
jgi:predicted Zn finger-like uncharacterized protein